MITRPTRGRGRRLSRPCRRRGRGSDRDRGAISTTLIPIIEIGLHHEQQHQELLLTDILHAFSLNATDPAYDPDWQWPARRAGATAACRTSSTASTRSATTATASASTTSSRRTRCCCSRCGCRRALVHQRATGSNSWPTAATRRRRLWLSDGWATVEARRLGRAGLLAQASTAPGSR